MNTEERTAFEVKFKYARAFWLGFASFHLVLIMLMWITEPSAFNVTFTEPILGENRIFVGLIALATVWVLFGLRRKNEYAANILDLKSGENLLAAGYLQSPMLALSVSSWGVVLAMYFEYAYSFIWFVIGFLSCLYVLPSRAKYEEIFRRVNKSPIDR